MFLSHRTGEALAPNEHCYATRLVVVDWRCTGASSKWKVIGRFNIERVTRARLGRKFSMLARYGTGSAFGRPLESRNLPHCRSRV
jgi:hypothetical protein